MTAWLCGVIGGVAGAPVPAVGALIIELLPPGLINWGTETLGAADKPVLLALVILGVLALAGLAGRLEQRRAYAGAAVARDRFTPWLIAPTLLGLLAGYLVLRMLVGGLRSWQSAAEAAGPSEAAMSRRSFLVAIGVTATIASVGAVLGRVLEATGRVAEVARARFRLPKPAVTDPVPAGADLAVDGLSPYLTPTRTSTGSTPRYGCRSSPPTSGR